MKTMILLALAIIALSLMCYKGNAQQSFGPWKDAFLQHSITDTVLNNTPTLTTKFMANKPTLMEKFDIWLANSKHWKLILVVFSLLIVAFVFFLCWQLGNG